MDRDRWAQVQAICLTALEQPNDERAAFVSRACGADRALLREVRSLLAEHDAEPDFLDAPLVLRPESHEGLGAPPARERYVGPYRLIRLLARGGMGEVFLAVEDSEGFRRPVAVKVIRQGLDTDEVLRRFHLERQIMASLEHPGIARLLDGGATDDGLPYFVMEYVEGLPIDEYCDERRLSVDGRLELFRAICDAVQYAHRSLIVHRDIKPDNVLVTEEGSPRLLDFGIGKVLAPDGSFGTAVETRAEARVLTPNYAAPEQLRSEAITTATDVFALGLLLYELLTGHHPYSTGLETPQEIERAVCDTDPERPSTRVGRVTTGNPGEGDRAIESPGRVAATSPAEVGARRSSRPGQLRRRLSGDLDNIVLMALRRDPARRYASPSAMAEDVRRHLEGLPVSARPDTLLYRGGKFVRRHAVGVTAAATVLVGLAAGTGVTVMQARRVAAERDKAVEVRGFLMEMFGAAGGDQAADTLSARRLLDLQADRVGEAYRDRPDLQAEMMDVLADGYDRLGLAGEAEPWARAALDMRRERLGPDHPDVAASLNTLGWAVHQQGRSREAEPFLRESVRIARAAGARSRVPLSRSLNDLGVVLESQGDLGEAESIYREALAIRVAELGPDHRSVGITANNLATSLFRQGRYSDAAVVGGQALEALRRSVGADHQRSVIAQSNLALFHRSSGDLRGAQEVFRDLVDRQTRLQGRGHPVTAWTIGNLAAVLNDADEREEAERLYREALATQEAALESDHPDIAATLSGIGDVLAARGSYGEAEAVYERALAMQIRRLGERHSAVGAVLSDLARVFSETGRDPEAVSALRRASSVWDESLGRDHPRTITLRLELARVLLRSDQSGPALVELEAAHRAARGDLVHETRLELAGAHLAAGHGAIADSLIQVTRQALERGDDASAALRDRMEALQARVAESAAGLTTGSPRSR